MPMQAFEIAASESNEPNKAKLINRINRINQSNIYLHYKGHLIQFMSYRSDSNKA